MAENISTNNINSGIVLPLALDDLGDQAAQTQTNNHSNIIFSKPFMRKILAEMVGTWLLIFAGCASVIVNINNDKVVTLPGIAFVWGFTVMVLIYSVGHISGAHFNPAVSIAFAASKNFPWKQVPAYIFGQVVGSTLAAGALRLVFNGKEHQFAGTLPASSNMLAQHARGVYTSMFFNVNYSSVNNACTTEMIQGKNRIQHHLISP